MWMHWALVPPAFKQGDAMLIEDFNDSSHVWPGGFRKFLCAASEEDLKPRGGRNDPMTARRLANIAVAMGHLTRQVNYTARLDFRPFAVHAITDAALDDKEYFVFSVMHMQRWPAARRCYIEHNGEL